MLGAVAFVVYAAPCACIHTKEGKEDCAFNECFKDVPICYFVLLKKYLVSLSKINKKTVFVGGFR